MKLNPEYRTNKGRKLTIAHDADGRPYIEIIGAFGIATAYDMDGNLICRWEASKDEIDEYNNAPEYTDDPAKTIDTPRAATVENMSGTVINFAAAVNLMDDEIREQLHAEGYESEQDFFAAYEKAHKKKYGTPWELSKPNPVF